MVYSVGRQGTRAAYVSRDATRRVPLFRLVRGHRQPEVKTAVFASLMLALCDLLSICLPNSLDNLSCPLL